MTARPRRPWSQSGGLAGRANPDVIGVRRRDDIEYELKTALANLIDAERRIASDGRRQLADTMAELNRPSPDKGREWHRGNVITLRWALGQGEPPLGNVQQRSWPIPSIQDLRVMDDAAFETAHGGGYTNAVQGCTMWLWGGTDQSPDIHRTDMSR